MVYNFDTYSLSHAKAALLLYAMYRSRNNNSPLNGRETWTRFQTFVRSAVLKSSTTAEFVQHFCRKAGVEAIRPRFLSTGDPVLMPGSGALYVSDDIKEYRLRVIEDNDLLHLYANESIYLIMLVRERIQREKIEMWGAEENEDQD